MIAGMDFGTTHSGMAVYDGQQLRTIPLNPLDSSERVTPTVLYITNGQKITFGRAATNAYFEQNLGRPSKLEKVWVGEITQTFAELPTFVRDVYIWVDVFSPGRLFLSFKTDLSDASYAGTAIGRFFYSLEDIVATYLHLAKRRAERFLGYELEEVVLGRPVKFNADPEADALAQARLLEGAWRAGYKKVYFEYEPIAAAHYYETMQNRPQNVLVFDFGGGTLDVTIMRLGDPQQRKVLATGGVPIAGDVFDRKIARARLPKHFGEGSLYRSMDKKLPVPGWIYDSFSDWRTMLTLQAPESMQTLRTIAPVAEKRRSIEALISLVSSNYSLKMFEVVERVKRQLSDQPEAVIRLYGEGFQVREPLTRREFNQLIRPEYRIIEAHLDETLHASGLRAEQIDVVIRTGGSSQIPLFKDLLAQKFGEAKVKAIDTFGSVTSGLGVIAHGIASGRIEAKGYSRSHAHARTVLPTRANIPLIDLDLIKRQIDWQEGAANDAQAEALTGFALLSKNYALTVAARPASVLEGPQITPTGLGLPADVAPQAALHATLDEPLLLITSAHRFLLVPARELLNYQTAGLALADIHRFDRGEQLCLIHRWDALKDHAALILVSNQGYARRFEMAQLRPLVEGPSLTKIDWSLPGWPKVVIGAQAQQTLVLVNNLGRAVRWPLEAVRRTGSRVIAKSKTDELIGGCGARDETAFWLLSADGYAKWVHAAHIPLALERAPQSTSSQSALPPSTLLVRRRGFICGLVAASNPDPVWVITTSRLLHIDPAATPHEGVESATMHKVIELGKGEGVLGVLQ